MLLLSVSLCLFFCGVSHGESSVRCGEVEMFSMEEARDGVDGRYRLEWCTQLTRPAAIWDVIIKYNTRRKPEVCLQYSFRDPQGYMHSHFEQEIKNDLNCTIVCLSKNIDLIFNATCYTVKMKFLSHEPNSQSDYSFGSSSYVKYVHNNYSKTHFTESKTYVAAHMAERNVIAVWYLGYIPANNYTMELCPKGSNGSEMKKCTEVTTCEVEGPQRSTISCTMPSTETDFIMRLTHHAPWCSGILLFGKQICVQHESKEFRALAGAPAVPRPGGRALWWALGALLALAAGAAAALAACRTHLARKLRERVLTEWPQMVSSRVSDAAAAAAAEAGARRPERTRVLLLYARDCAAAMEAARRLRALLLHAVDQVYDLYSAETAREAARAPGEWVRRVVAREDVRVLLLQSPAAECLYAAHVRERGARLQLQRPLLNQRVAYRTPSPGDSLLLLALRLLADASFTALAYKKFYIATITGLEAEVVREVTPLRRYALPDTASLLLNDIAAPRTLTPPQDKLEELAESLRAFVEYVRDKPDYLDDELIFYDADT